MNQQSRWAAYSAIAVTALMASTVDAQVYIGGGRGIVVNAPGAFVRVGPFGSGIVVVPRYRMAPAYVQPVAPPVPSAAEILQLGDAELLNAVLTLTARLDADLGRFTSAASWRNYVRLPEDALPPPVDGRVVIGIDSLKRTLASYDAAASNPGFRQITSLPSFAAAHTAIAETVRRFGAEPAVDSARPRVTNLASSSEELPAPPPALVPPQNNSTNAERSVLSK